MSYVAPVHWQEAFTCPLCNAYSQQRWGTLSFDNGAESDFDHSLCTHCREMVYWYKEKMIVPDASMAPIANPDTPPNVLDAYNEAREIVNKSPRGAAALLRLGIQELCGHLGHGDKSINDAIKAMVAEGLPSRVQKALDSVRVVGNNAVHPGEIDLNEKPDTAAQLFGLINFIVEKTISEPAEIDSFFDEELPTAAKNAIAKRDGNNSEEGSSTADTSSEEPAS